MPGSGGLAGPGCDFIANFLFKKKSMNESVWKISNVRAYLRDKDCNHKIKGFLFLMMKYTLMSFACFTDRMTGKSVQWSITIGNKFEMIIEIKNIWRDLLLCVVSPVYEHSKECSIWWLCCKERILIDQGCCIYWKSVKC